ncbi:MAG: hypothetical protein MZW92_13565 [Comamonadaceae bacterium]|nr:hypothetical protein [Comamonadaceae bacterium]
MAADRRTSGCLRRGREHRIEGAGRDQQALRGQGSRQRHQLQPQGAAHRGGSRRRRQVRDRAASPPICRTCRRSPTISRSARRQTWAPAAATATSPPR